MKQRRITISVATLALIVVALIIVNWQTIAVHWRFVRLFESIGPNAQGYPEYRHRKTRIVMVRLPGGSFWMGAQKGDPAAPNFDPRADLTGSGEDLVHRVTLSPFLISKYEVTQAQWQGVTGSNPSRFQGTNAPPQVDSTTLPVDSVYRDEIEAQDGFLARTGLRLPTEAQWEYACRARKEEPGAGASELAELAWYDEKDTPSGRPIVFPPGPAPTPRGSTHPVGTKKPNEFGLYDMLGNVSEWCEDTFNNVFYAQSAGAKDPLSAEGSTDGVFRGGSWNDGSDECRCSRRSAWRTNESRVPHLGLRVTYYPLP